MAAEVWEGEQRWLRGGTTTLLVGMTEWRRRPVVARRGDLGGTAVAPEEEGTAVAALRWEACRREKEGVAVAAGQWQPTLALLSGIWVATLAARLACERAVLVLRLDMLLGGPLWLPPPAALRSRRAHLVDMSQTQQPSAAYLEASPQTQRPLAARLFRPCEWEGLFSVLAPPLPPPPPPLGPR